MITTAIKKKVFFDDWVLIVLLILAAFLLFKDLGDAYLWEDESTWALLGRSVLREGVPKAWDGKNLIEVVTAAEYNDDFMWMQQPWVPFYLIAGSFFLLGETEFAARLPFAICGLFSFYMLYCFVYRLLDNRLTARLSVTIMLSSAVYLLHMRQCSYYSLVPLCMLGVLFGYSEAAMRQTFRPFLFTIFSVLLFHSFYPVFFAMMFTVIIDAIIRHDKKLTLFMLKTLSVVFLFTFPWFLFTKMYTYIGGGGGMYIRQALQTYLIYIYQFIMPIPMLVAVPLVLFIRKGEKMVFDPRARLLVLAVCSIVILVLAKFLLGPRFRYVLGILPLCSIFMGWQLSSLWVKKRVLSLIVLGLLIGSNVLFVCHQFFVRPYPRIQDRQIVFVNEPPRLYSYMVDFFYDLFHDYKGPNEYIDEVIKHYGHTAETVKTNHGGQPIIFYTDLVTIPQTRMRNEIIPDWVIIRGTNEYLEGLLHVDAYEQIRTLCPDIPFGNNPDPTFYHYRDIWNDLPRLVLYHRRQSDTIEES